jgi:hypothetical protein
MNTETSTAPSLTRCGVLRFASSKVLSIHHLSKRLGGQTLGAYSKDYLRFSCRCSEVSPS